MPFIALQWDTNKPVLGDEHIWPVICDVPKMQLNDGLLIIDEKHKEWSFITEDSFPNEVIKAPMGKVVTLDGHSFMVVNTDGGHDMCAAFRILFNSVLASKELPSHPKLMASN